MEREGRKGGVGRGDVILGDAGNKMTEVEGKEGVLNCDGD